VLALCLVGAVRRLAPRAESQAAMTRLIALLGFVAVPFLRARDVPGQIALSAGFFVFVAALEMGRPEEPMEAHWRAWSRFGAWGRWVGRFVQPGWASATEWLLLVCGIGAVAGLASAQPARTALLVIFAAEALIFPALLLTWMTRQFTHHLAGYALVLVGGSILSAVERVAAANTNVAIGAITNLSTLIDRLVMLLPIASFWTTLSTSAPFPTRVVLPQLLIAGLVLAGAWVRGRPYRRQRRVFDTQPTEAPLA
jgi:hypothetical protein